MTSNYRTDDPILGQIDLDDYFITDSWLVDQFVGNGLWAWGHNGYGQLGFRDTVRRSSPVQVGSLTNWRSISDGARYHILATKSDGTLWSWGSNSPGGQLGLNSATFSTSSPAQVGSLTNWKQVSAGYQSSAAVKTDGTLWTWGQNDLGQLGINGVVARSSPAQVGTLTNWKQVACGYNHTAAVKTDGTLWTWGDNNVGQLGLSNITSRSSPVQVGTLTNWKQVACGKDGFGNSWAAATKTDGTLWTWGGNSLAYLGLGDTTPRSSPVQVGSLTNWKIVFAGFYFTYGIKTDNTLWGWGWNGGGGLGASGPDAGVSSPIQIGTTADWKNLFHGREHTLGIKTDGTLWGWGTNGTGAAGSGNTTSIGSPLQIGNLTNWKLVGGCTYSSFAVNYADIT